jgi:hypothetical protein
MRITCEDAALPYRTSHDIRRLEVRGMAENKQPSQVRFTYEKAEG